MPDKADYLPRYINKAGGETTSQQINRLHKRTTTYILLAAEIDPIVPTFVPFPKCRSGRGKKWAENFNMLEGRAFEKVRESSFYTRSRTNPTNSQRTALPSITDD